MKYCFETYENSETTKEEILEKLSLILKQKNCTDIIMPVFTCINELLVNALKANFKNLYFEKYAPVNNALEVIPYHKALQLFKLEMATNRIDYLVALAQENGVTAKIELQLNDDCLNVNVINPAEITEVEKENIRKKREFANTYNNLTEYFCEVESDPNKEGGGLGILFILLVLKSFGLDENHLKITSANGITNAHLYIPLHEKIVNNYLNNTKG
ncbi:MAG: hypothetical protein PF637_05420 [Spirochaetes bacterium]|jgi:hypothetical protein|nr:hypothetical protein [Spirochaetota bacterium]